MSAYCPLLELLKILPRFGSSNELVTFGQMAISEDGQHLIGPLYIDLRMASRICGEATNEKNDDLYAWWRALSPYSDSTCLRTTELFLIVDQNQNSKQSEAVIDIMFYRKPSPMWTCPLSARRQIAVHVVTVDL